MYIAYTCSTYAFLLDKEFLCGLVFLHVQWDVAVEQLAALSIAEVWLQTELDWHPRLPAGKRTSSWGGGGRGGGRGGGGYNVHTSSQKHFMKNVKKCRDVIVKKVLEQGWDTRSTHYTHVGRN